MHVQEDFVFMNGRKELEEVYDKLDQERKVYMMLAWLDPIDHHASQPLLLVKAHSFIFFAFQSHSIKLWSILNALSLKLCPYS